MTASVVQDLHAIRQQRHADQFRQDIRCASSPARLDALAELIRDARGGGRLSLKGFLALDAEIDARRHVLAILAFNPSPSYCCGERMEREVGPRPDPSPAGHLVVEEVEVCRVCGHTWPVLGDEWDRDEVRRRIEEVRRHNREVTDHTDCKDDQPCKATRPGLSHLRAVPNA